MVESSESSNVELLDFSYAFIHLDVYVAIAQFEVNFTSLDTSCIGL